MQLTQFLHAAADARPNATATIFGERQQSWAAHRDRVSRLADAIRALGGKHNDRGAILALDSDRDREYYTA